MEFKKKIGIVGYGNIGKRHAKIITDLEDAELVGICDVDLSLEREIYRTFPKANFYSDYATFLKESDVDIVAIATPHYLHAEMTAAACSAKKHVLVEKPMALTRADCLAMAEAAESNNVRLWVVKQNRYNAPILMAQSAIEQGQLGRIYSIHCNVFWNRTDLYYDESPWRGKSQYEGGALFTQASHFVDLLIRWGGEHESVKAIVQKQKHNIEIEDIGLASIVFKNGIVGGIQWTNNVYSRNYEGSITIIAEKGTIKIGGPYLNEIEFWDVEGFPLKKEIPMTDKPNMYNGYSGSGANHSKVYENILLDLKDSTSSNLVFGNEGALSVKLISDIYKAAEDN